MVCMCVYVPLKHGVYVCVCPSKAWLKHGHKRQARVHCVFLFSFFGKNRESDKTKKSRSFFRHKRLTRGGPLGNGADQKLVKINSGNHRNN